MRVVVTGSRGWTDRAALFGALDVIAHAARYNAEELTIVHGCALGADTLADEWVTERRAAGWPVTVERFPADWNQHGKRAGMVRNEAMLKPGADACLAFVRNKSKGATHCGEVAESHGIPTQWVRRDA